MNIVYVTEPFGDHTKDGRPNDFRPFFYDDISFSPRFSDPAVVQILEKNNFVDLPRDYEYFWSLIGGYHVEAGVPMFTSAMFANFGKVFSGSKTITIGHV